MTFVGYKRTLRCIRTECAWEKDAHYFLFSSFPVTLHDIVHTDKSLTLVFEYLDRDLKQYMDECGAQLSMNNVKVSNHTCRVCSVKKVLDNTPPCIALNGVMIFWIIRKMLMCSPLCVGRSSCSSCCEALPTATSDESCTGISNLRICWSMTSGNSRLISVLHQTIYVCGLIHVYNWSIALFTGVNGPLVDRDVVAFLHQTVDVCGLIHVHNWSQGLF